MTESIGSPALYAGFTALVAAMLALDLGVFHRKAHAVRFKEALVWSIVWIGLAMAFNFWVGATFGPQKRLGSNAHRLSQITDGRWKVISDYFEPPKE